VIGGKNVLALLVDKQEAPCVWWWSEISRAKLEEMRKAMERKKLQKVAGRASLQRG